MRRPGAAGRPGLSFASPSLIRPAQVQGRVPLAPPDGAIAPDPLVPPDEFVVEEVPGALTVSSVLRLQAPRLIAVVNARAIVAASFILDAYMSVSL